MSRSPSPAAAPLFELDRVGFARSGRHVLADIDWRIDAGERWAVLGPNGCGKSTLLKLAIGMLWPTSGTIRREGEEYLDLPAFRSRIGWITDAVGRQSLADLGRRLTGRRMQSDSITVRQLRAPPGRSR